MKAVVFQDGGDIRLDDVPAPSLPQPTDPSPDHEARSAKPGKR
jgi:hypothetical protein